VDIDRRPTEKIRFGSYEVDLASCELRKGGIKLRLQPQPFQVLRLLLDRTGEVVSREELKQELWPDDTYVEFDLSLNTVIKKLRRALSDNPQTPRYIETLPRNGYRFIFPIERIDAVIPNEAVVETVLADGSLLHVLTEAGVLQSAPVLRIVTSNTELIPGSLGEAQIEINRDGVMVPRRRRVLERTAALLVAALLVGVGAFYLAEAPSENHVRRWSFPVPSISSVSISPDGKYILFATQAGGEPGLWIRSTDQESPRRLAGAESATGGFWSPDSQFVAFAADGQLMKVSAGGANPIVLCELPNSNTNFFAGGSWSPDAESIVFSSGARLYQVSSGGGAPNPLFGADQGLRGSFQWPHFLPSSGRRQAIVYTASTNFRDHRMEVMDLATGARRDLGPGSVPVYSPDGYLIHGPSNNELTGLWAVPFSLETLAPSGDALHINSEGIGASISTTGDLVYWDNPRPIALHRLAWRDRTTGRVLERTGEAQFAIRDPVISPDGQRVLVSSAEAGESNIYLHDLRRSTKVQLTSDVAEEAGGRWSSDGSNVVFWRQVGDQAVLIEKAANSGGAGTILYTVHGTILDLDLSRDGKYLVLLQHADAESREIRYIPTAELGEGAQSSPYLGRKSRGASPRISPNGRYLAFESHESGRVEVFVGSFPDGALLLRKISTRGGRSPRWSPNGKDLFYLQGDSLVAVSVQSASRGITLGSPQELFSSPDLSLGFAPSTDGQRFLTVEPVGEPLPPAVHVIENWHGGLNRPAAEAGIGW